MLDLRDLIIERIEQSKHFFDNSSTNNNYNSNALESEFQVNRKKLKQFTNTKKKQKERINKQKQLLQKIQAIRFWQYKILQNFFSISLAIFASYNSQYLTLLQNGSTISQKLSYLYSQFVRQELPNHNMVQLSQLVKGQITQSTPRQFFHCLCSWSRNQLYNKLNSAMNQQFDRHQQEMRRISFNRSLVQSKEKIVNPLTFSSHVQKIEESQPPKITLTNKQSVYGLFLDDLLQYYKTLPLQLDISFLKTMRKAHGKGNQFQRQDNLQRAVQILIQSKNKHTKQQLAQFKKQYYSKYPDKNRIFSQQEKRNQSPLKKVKKVQNMKQQFFQRIKSEQKQQKLLKNQEKRISIQKSSFLLCPKPTQISFQSSKQIVKEIRRQKLRKQYELPQLMPHKNISPHSKSTVSKSKYFTSFINSSTNSAVNMSQSKKNINNTKCYQFKVKSIQKSFRKNNFSCFQEPKKKKEENPQKEIPKINGDEFRKNRKLMLQLLRQKNRYAFIQN